jgi:hypothetical protein
MGPLKTHTHYRMGHPAPTERRRLTSKPDLVAGDWALVCFAHETTLCLRCTSLCDGFLSVECCKCCKVRRRVLRTLPMSRYRLRGCQSMRGQPMQRLRYAPHTNYIYYKFPCCCQGWDRRPRFRNSWFRADWQDIVPA